MLPTDAGDSVSYKKQFDDKIARLNTYFSKFSLPQPEYFESPPSRYRMRAEFKVWHEDDCVYYAMFKPGKSKEAIKIDGFPIGSEFICQLMPALLSELNNDPTLRQRLFQVEFLSTSVGDMLITLLYHRKLDVQWEQRALRLQETLGCKIIGRSRGQKIALSEDFVVEQFNIGGKQFRYQQVETGFTQPNASVCAHMLEWAQRVTRNLGNDLLELYCGNGNFTLPLAENFRRVLATEVSKTSVNSALYNIELNRSKNIDVVRLSSEELTQAINNEREFRRLKDITIADFQFSTVFVDPPRAGLDEATAKMITRFDNILYISCNPETLESNLQTLYKTHSIEAFAFFDQFPYTEHCECGMLLSKRT